MMKVFQIAEEIESLEDLHILCTMMTIICKPTSFYSKQSYTQLYCHIVTLNDNGLYEYLLQEDIFIGVAGMMECKSSRF
jgi:protein phosphatase-4 regulatory subunit 3